MKKEEKKSVKKINKTENKSIEKENKYHKFLWYTIIFSLIGLLIEVIVCFIQKIVLKEEFGLILGSLNIIYGIIVSIIIALLDKFKDKKIRLFILGSLLGCAIEYIISFILEATLGIKLWNTMWTKYKVNARTCLEHAIAWGTITIITILLLKKIVDKLINKIKGKTRKIVDITFTIIILIQIIFAIWGLVTYKNRSKDTLNGINYTSNNNIIEKFQNRVFSNEIMERMFKNLEINDNEGNKILVKKING